jgi:hypothetical protein
LTKSNLKVNLLFSIMPLASETSKRVISAYLQLSSPIGEPHIWDTAELKRQFESLPAEQQTMLRRTAARIEKFAKSQRDCISDLVTKIDGGKAGHDVIAIERAGCYAPGK